MLSSCLMTSRRTLYNEPRTHRIDATAQLSHSLRWLALGERRSPPRTSPLSLQSIVRSIVLLAHLALRTYVRILVAGHQNIIIKPHFE
jgi:hypothetical protein